MGSGIALDDAAIVSTALECILYGFSLPMFIGTVWVLTRKQGNHASNWKRLSIAIILLVLSTTHVVVDIVRIDEGLVKFRNTFPGGPVAFFEDIAQHTFVIKNALFTLQTLLGDAVVIYRCYVVWQTIWIIILPLMLWCSVAVTAVASVYSVSQATINATNIFARETGQWITAFYASTLATNLLSSGLLAYRVWTIERNVSSIRAAKKSAMWPILRVLVDAALLCSATLSTALVCFSIANNGQYVVLDLVMPITAISFYMVLFRIAIRRKSYSTRRGSTTGDRTLAVESQDTAYGKRPLQVYISRFSRSDLPPQYLPGNQELEMDHWSSIPKRRSDGAAYAI